jgi:2-dehydropantoate 2-reductase
VLEELPRDQRVQLVIVLVKAFDTEAVAKDLSGRIGSDTPVLTLQNGLGNAEELASRLSPDQILAGATTMGALREAPGEVQLTGRGGCEIGAWSGAGERYLPQIQQVLQQAGIACRCTKNTSATLWKKLVVNAAINPLTAILRVRNGALLERAELEPVIRAVTEEVWQVGSRRGIHLPEPPELYQEICRVCRVTAANRSSMLRDVEEHRRTEIDAINGAVVRLGNESGMPTPVNSTLAALVRAATDRRTSAPRNREAGE